MLEEDVYSQDHVEDGKLEIVGLDVPDTSIIIGK